MPPYSRLSDYQRPMPDDSWNSLGQVGSGGLSGYGGPWHNPGGESDEARKQQRQQQIAALIQQMDEARQAQLAQQLQYLLEQGKTLAKAEPTAKKPFVYMERDSFEVEREE